MRKGTPVGVVACLVGLTSAHAALASEFGYSGRLALGAERLMGFVYASASSDSSDTHLTYFALFGNPSHATPYDIPRVTLDGFVADGISLGGGFAVANVSPEDGDDTTFVLLSPRIGGVVGAGRSLDLWFRGGFTYYSATTGDYDFSGTGLNLDVLFVVQVAQSFAIALGPAMDIGLSGDANGNDMKLSSYGVTAGLVGGY